MSKLPPDTVLQVDKELMQEFASEHHEFVQAQPVDPEPLPLHRLDKYLEIQQRCLQDSKLRSAT